LNAVGYSISVPEVESVKVQLVPNPTTANAVVRAFGASVTSVEVYDILGRPVFARSLNAEEVELPSALWAPGAYFVRLHTARGVHTAKLIRH